MKAFVVKLFNISPRKGDSIKYYITLLVFLSPFLYNEYLFAQPKDLNQTLKIFKKAKFLYLLNEPTESSDATAIQYFLWVATSTEPHLKTDYKIESWIKAGNIHQGYGRFKESQLFYHNALAENKSNPNTALAYEAYLYLGSSLYFNGILDSAKFYLEITADIASKFRNKVYLPQLHRLYNSLGAIYYEGANYQQALNYFELSLELTSPMLEDYSYFYSTLKSNIANCLLRLNSNDSAIQIFKSITPPPTLKSNINQNLAHAYFEKGVYDSALTIYKSTSLAGGIYKVVALNDIGRIYMRKGLYKEAGRYLDSALKENNILTGNLKNKEGALTYLYKAELAQKQNQIENSLLFCNLALKEVHLSFKAINKLDLPTDVSKSLSPITFYRILVFKAELLYRSYHKNKATALLKASLLTYVKAFETANFISKNFDNDDAKIYFLGNSKIYYEKAMQVAYEISMIDPVYLQQVLFILESYKGNIIRQNLEYNKILSHAGIPDSLIKRENELKGLYSAYLTKINLATNQNEAAQLQNRLNKLMVELAGMHRAYEKYESYYQIRENLYNAGLPIHQIQSSIGKQTVLLNFFVSDSIVYIFFITHKQAKLVRIATDNQFNEALSVYLSKTLQIKEGQRYSGYAPSNHIFQILFKPIYGEIRNFHNMVIIPDGYFFYLPIDVLTKTAGKRDYLLYTHAISYHYSVSLFLEKFHKKAKVILNDSTLAFAPFGVYEQNKSQFPPYLALPYSLQEIDHSNTKKFSGVLATREQFFNNYAKYNILHLATHASLGKDSSANWIQFYPDSNSQSAGRLYVHEVYNMKLSQHELVILSACESGSGLTIDGEGLLSVSRAFMYAGAEGVISTMYKTDDMVTAFLMKRLFYYLDKNIAPEEALRRSKIDLLESDQINYRFKAPNYWGNFIYVGKSTPQKKSAWKIIIFISTLIPVTYYIVKRVSNKYKPR